MLGHQTTVGRIITTLLLSPLIACADPTPPARIDVAGVWAGLFEAAPSVCVRMILQPDSRDPRDDAATISAFGDVGACPDASAASNLIGQGQRLDDDRLQLFLSLSTPDAPMYRYDLRVTNESLTGTSVLLRDSSAGPSAVRWRRVAVATNGVAGRYVLTATRATGLYPITAFDTLLLSRGGTLSHSRTLHAPGYSCSFVSTGTYVASSTNVYLRRVTENTACPLGRIDSLQIRGTTLVRRRLFEVPNAARIDTLEETYSRL